MQTHLKKTHLIPERIRKIQQQSEINITFKDLKRKVLSLIAPL